MSSIGTCAVSTQTNAGGFPRFKFELRYHHLSAKRCHGDIFLFSKQPVSALSSDFRGKGHVGALLVLLSHHFRAGLRGVSIYNLCEKWECHALVERLTICSRRCIEFNKRHRVTLKGYYGTRFSQEICSQKACCLRRE